MKRTHVVIALACLASSLFGQRIDFGTSPGTIPPRIVSKTEPQYSPQAGAAAIQGKVVLQLEVGTDGFAHNLQIIKTLGSLDQRAMEAVRQWRFQPGTKDGRPVTMSATVDVDFRLELTEQESGFHRYARHEFEQAIDAINFNMELRRKYSTENSNRVPAGAAATSGGSAQEIQRISAEIKIATDQLPALEYRMAHADDCAKVYQATFGKSALSTTEAALVQVCQTAKLYPPQR